MKLLDLDQVTKFYDINKPGIIKATMTFEEGKFYGLVGPNGSGKSTLLKIMNGIHGIDKGKIHYFERYPNISPFRDYLGYVPDSESVWRSLTTREFIIYINQLFKISIDKEFFDSMNMFLDLFDLTKRQNDLLESFSFGMKKKVQIIATFLHKPCFLSIDEPMFGLDPESIMILMELIKKYISGSVVIDVPGNSIKIKPSVIVATHQLEYAEQYCTDFFLLSKNRLKLSGTLNEIFSELDVNNLNDAFIKSAGRIDKVKEKLHVIEDSIFFNPE